MFNRPRGSRLIRTFTGDAFAAIWRMSCQPGRRAPDSREGKITPVRAFRKKVARRQEIRPKAVASSAPTAPRAVGAEGGQLADAQTLAVPRLSEDPPVASLLIAYPCRLASNADADWLSQGERATSHCAALASRRPHLVPPTEQGPPPTFLAPRRNQGSVRAGPSN